MKTSRYKNLGPLHDLLLEVCPGPKKSIVTLSVHLECTHQYIYRWIENGRMPPQWAKRCSELSGIPLERFMPFVFG